MQSLPAVVRRCHFMATVPLRRRALRSLPTAVHAKNTGVRHDHSERDITWYAKARVSPWWVAKTFDWSMAAAVGESRATDVEHDIRGTP